MGTPPSRLARRQRPGTGRRLAVTLLLLALAPMAAGCIRVNASITVSPDDQVSGEIIAAAKPRDKADDGPKFDENVSLRQKIVVSKYEADGYVGSQASFSRLSFAEVPQLANLSRDANRVDISLRRAGNLVVLEGRVDLTTVSDPDAEVTFSAAFPGEVTSTNGERVGAGTVTWKMKPGAVTTISAQVRYTDPSTRSFAGAAIWLSVAALLVAGLIAYLAWRDRDQTSPRFVAAGHRDELQSEEERASR